MTSLRPTLILVLLGVALFASTTKAQVRWPPIYPKNVAFDDESSEEESSDEEYNYLDFYEEIMPTVKPYVPGEKPDYEDDINYSESEESDEDYW